MEIPDHLICLLRNLYAGQEAMEPDMEQWTGSKLGKEHDKVAYYHPAYLTSMQSTSCEIPGWMNHKLDFEEAEEPEIKLQTFIGSWRQQENTRKTSTSASLTMLNPLTAWITTNCGKFLKRWEYQTTLLSPEKPESESRSKS